MGVKHSTGKSFVFAFKGIITAFKEEPNFKIHIIIGILAAILAFFLGFTAIEWTILVLTISLVLILELVNTAMESIVNIVSPDIHPEAKIAKDVAASAVLIAAVASIIIGALLFIPKMVL